MFANSRNINKFALPNFHDSSKQILLQVLHYLEEYYRIKNVPVSLKLRAVIDPINKSLFGTVYTELNGYECFKTLLTKFLWNSPTQSGIKCSIYQDKFTRQDVGSMKSHYLRHANNVTNFQPGTSEEELVGAST